MKKYIGYIGHKSTIVDVSELKIYDTSIETERSINSIEMEPYILSDFDGKDGKQNRRERRKSERENKSK